ncbi:thioredoxin family protein [Candidatus Woesearchaeota archaeon]|nr:thioredoxin family protein [Candidatus Woesearchaeota archaeon]
MAKKFDWARKLYNDRFKRYLIIALLVIGISLLFNHLKDNEQVSDNNLVIHFFFHPQCPHCQEQKPFNAFLMEKYPSVEFIPHDVTNSREAALLNEFAQNYNVPKERLGVPATFFGPYRFIGFDSAETTGKEIEAALKAHITEQNETAREQEEKSEFQSEINLPFIGKVDVLNYSLPALAVILGLVDGFNPCAMWVLVYLISLIAAIRDRRKIWLLVGTFVLASGILYFLFMTAWLNVFLLIGYMRPLTIIIGLGALYVGLTSIRDYVKTKNALVCEVTDEASKEKTMSRIERIVKSPLTLATIFGIIALAFIVNSIEFACSSAIPAVFTYVLSISSLSTLQYYAYILLYDLFFMLDDLIIFSLAAFAVNTAIGTKYAKYSKLIGGIVLLILGLLLAFAPHLLG